MARIKLTQFKGQNMAVNPALLVDTIGTNSLNQDSEYVDLRPIKNNQTIEANIDDGVKTLYRFVDGLGAVSFIKFFNFTNVIDAQANPNSLQNVRGYIYTDGVSPKLVYKHGSATANTWNLGLSPNIIAPSMGITQGANTTLPTETVYFVCTYVDYYGRESAPSPVAGPFTVDANDTVNIAFPGNLESQNVYFWKKRLYRTKTGSSETEFFFLLEVVSNTIQYSFLYGNYTIGGILPTATWLPPPNDITYLTPMWNGMLAGISNGTVRFCEPYVSYAWPVAYEILPGDAKAVGLAVFGQNLLVLTDGKPIVVTGSSPDSLSESPVEFLHPCVSVQSIASTGYGVIYASNEGLAYVGSDGARLLTEGVIQKADWAASGPENVRGAFHKGKYHFTGNNFTGVDNDSGFNLDPKNPSSLYRRYFENSYFYVDNKEQKLYTVNNVEIQLVEGDTTNYLFCTFRSKLFSLDKPIPAFAWGQVIADNYPVTFRLIRPSQPEATRTTQYSVINSKPFRLAGGYMDTDFYLEISTNYPVRSVAVAHNIAELAQ